jgi:hypothetical protein
MVPQSQLTDKLSAQEVRLQSVLALLLRLQDAAKFVNNPMQRKRFCDFLAELSKSFMQMKIEQNTSKDLLADSLLKQWEGCVAKVNDKIQEVKNNLAIHDNDKEIIFSLLEGLKKQIADVKPNDKAEFDDILHKMKQLVEYEPSCFLSYAWGTASVTLVHQLAQDLRAGGVEVNLDIWHNTLGTSIVRFAERILKTDYVALMGSPAMVHKYGLGLSNFFSVNSI